MPQHYSDPMQASARLIAAAPDLLAALEAILNAYIDETTRANNGAPICSNRITQARDAIAAARGGES